MNTNPTNPAQSGYYHVCFAVPDLHKAMSELTEMLGVHFGDPIEAQLGPWPYSLVFSDAQPYIELIQSVPGSPWGTSKPTFHHIGIWTPDLPGTVERWKQCGGTAFFDGQLYGRRFSYVDGPHSGARLEAVDLSHQETFLQCWENLRTGSVHNN